MSGPMASGRRGRNLTASERLGVGVGAADPVAVSPFYR